MITEWSPVCPNCKAAVRQDVEEDISIFYKGDALHVHGFPSKVICGKCRWVYGWEYSCGECVEEAIDGGDNAKATKKSAKKSRKSDQ